MGVTCRLAVVCDYCAVVSGTSPPSWVSRIKSMWGTLQLKALLSSWERYAGFGLCCFSVNSEYEYDISVGMNTWTLLKWWLYFQSKDQSSLFDFMFERLQTEPDVSSFNFNKTSILWLIFQYGHYCDSALFRINERGSYFIKYMIYCEIIFIHWTFNIMYFVGRLNPRN